MKGIFIAMICASGLGFITSHGAENVGEAREFASPAAEQSFEVSGDISQLPSDQAYVAHIDADSVKQEWGRSTGCSTGCSVGCSTGCSVGCSTGCSIGCRH